LGRLDRLIAQVRHCAQGESKRKFVEALRASGTPRSAPLQLEEQPILADFSLSFLLEEFSGWFHYAFCDSFSCDFDVFAINVKSNETSNPALLRGESRMADPHEGIEHDQVGPTTVQLDAKYSKVCRKRGGVRTLFGAAYNGFIWNEPVVTATTQVMASRVGPSVNV
jgi:hypothetical protein